MEHRLRRFPYSAVAVLAVLALGGCTEDLYSGLAEQEANSMVAELAQRGIAATRRSAKDGKITIAVDDANFATAVAALNEAGYPHKKFESMGEIFKSSGLVPSPTEERARFLYAIDQELSATISQIDNVLSARVEVVLPENDILARNPSPASASVFVRYVGGSGVEQLVPQLKALVANSVQGLTYDQVSVVLVPVTRRASPPVAPPPHADVRTAALSALAGGLVACSAGILALAFRLGLVRSFRKGSSGRRRGNQGASPASGLLGRIS